MATIHAHPNSPFWVAHFVDSGNKRTSRSTRLKAIESTREKALAMATAWEKASALAAAGSDGRAWMVETLNEIFGKEGLPGVPCESWTSIAERCLEARGRRGLVKPTMVHYRTSVASLSQSLGAKKDKDLRSITPADIERWLAAYLKTTTATTAAWRLTHIRSVFNYAVRQGVLPTNPAAAVDSPPRDGLSREPFTLLEVHRLLTHVRGEALEGGGEARDFLTLILLGLCTGARLGDCARMTWANVDLGAMRLTYLPKKKSRKGQQVEVAVVDPLASHLSALPTTQGFLCPVMAGWDVPKLSSSFVELLARAGIHGTKVTEGRRRPFNPKTFHSLRHTLASLLAEAGVDDLVRRRITDHQDKKVAAIYQHVSVDATRRALNQVLAPMQALPPPA